MTPLKHEGCHADKYIVTSCNGTEAFICQHHDMVCFSTAQSKSDMILDLKGYDILSKYAVSER